MYRIVNTQSTLSKIGVKCEHARTMKHTHNNIQLTLVHRLISYV